jgi:hypothetical protein
MKRAIVWISLVSLAALVSVSRPEKKTQEFCDKFRVGSLHCSCKSMDGGVGYCLAIRQIAGEGYTKIVVNDRITNLNEISLSVQLKGRVDDLYDLRVSDRRGNRLLSKKEQAEALAREKYPKGQGPINPDVTSQRHEPVRELSTGEFIESEYDLSAFFDLKSGRRYRINFGRNMIRQKNGPDVNLANFEVEIKIPNK